MASIQHEIQEQVILIITYFLALYQLTLYEMSTMATGKNGNEQKQ